MSGDEATVFRPGGVSYLRIPATNPIESAAFYQAVFNWRVRDHGDSPAFQDATGHVIGRFMQDLPVAGASGVIPYVFVESVHETLEAVTARGGSLVTPPYPEGDLLVATFSDPAGNVIGVWQRAAS